MLIKTAANGVLSTDEDHPLFPVVDLVIFDFGLCKEVDQTPHNGTDVDLLIKGTFLDRDDDIRFLSTVESDDLLFRLRVFDSFLFDGDESFHLHKVQGLCDRQVGIQHQYVDGCLENLNRVGGDGIRISLCVSEVILGRLDTDGHQRFQGDCGEGGIQHLIHQLVDQITLLSLDRHVAVLIDDGQHQCLLDVIHFDHTVLVGCCDLHIDVHDAAACFRDVFNRFILIGVSPNHMVIDIIFILVWNPLVSQNLDVGKDLKSLE